MTTPAGSQAPKKAPREGSAPGPAVILAAHGSARVGASAEPVLALAYELSRRGFSEVRTAFWKEEPFLHQAVELTRGDPVLVLPVFLAEGYFTRTVVPRELGLRYGANPVGGRRVDLLPPLGADPAVADVVLARARAAVGDDASGSLLVVLGHGTPRDPGSADAVLAASTRLAGLREFARVAPAFIDQEPRIDHVLAEARETQVVVVPFLVAEGWHGGVTVPRELQERGPRVLYTEPVGTHPALVDLIEARLRAAAAQAAMDGAQAAPLAAVEPALAERLRRAGRVTLLQVMVTRDPSGACELRHVDDASASGLREVSSPADLGRLARGPRGDAHRALRTAADLPRGWRFRAATLRVLVDALVELYGPAVAHWHLGERGELATASFMDTASTQSGIYARLTQVEAPAVEAGIRRTCDGIPCLRVRLWGVQDAVASGDERTSEPGRLTVPCPRPCPILLASVLELASGPDDDLEDSGVDDPSGLG